MLTSSNGLGRVSHALNNSNSHSHLNQLETREHAAEFGLAVASYVHSAMLQVYRPSSEDSTVCRPGDFTD